MHATLNFAAPSMVPLESGAPRSIVLFRSSLTTRNELFAAALLRLNGRSALTDLGP